MSLKLSTSNNFLDKQLGKYLSILMKNFNNLTSVGEEGWKVDIKYKKITPLHLYK